MPHPAERTKEVRLAYVSGYRDGIYWVLQGARIRHDHAVSLVELDTLVTMCRDLYARIRFVLTNINNFAFSFLKCNLNLKYIHTICNCFASFGSTFSSTSPDAVASGPGGPGGDGGGRAEEALSERSSRARARQIGPENDEHLSHWIPGSKREYTMDCDDSADDTVTSQSSPKRIRTLQRARSGSGGSGATQAGGMPRTMPGPLA